MRLISAVSGVQVPPPLPSSFSYLKGPTISLPALFHEPLAGGSFSYTVLFLRVSGTVKVVPDILSRDRSPYRQPLGQPYAKALFAASPPLNALSS